MLIAITREVSPALAGCELSQIARETINVALAVAQHAEYQRTLETLGCRVHVLPAQPAMPDSVFVEDTAIVLDEVAVLTRPGAESRRAEVASIAEALQPFRPLLNITAPATLDGGDVLHIGRKLFVGLSQRSNTEGINQLRELLRDYGYRVEGAPIHGCLHLKSAVTQVSDGTVLLQPEWIDKTRFADMRIIEVHPDEPHAANVVCVNNTLLMPASFPRTWQRLLDTGFDVVTVDMSELQKAEGAATCCSLLFRDTEESR